MRELYEIIKTELDQMAQGGYTSSREGDRVLIAKAISHELIENAGVISEVLKDERD